MAEHNDPPITENAADQPSPMPAGTPPPEAPAGRIIAAPEPNDEAPKHSKWDVVKSFWADLPDHLQHLTKVLAAIPPLIAALLLVNAVLSEPIKVPWGRATPTAVLATTATVAPTLTPKVAPTAVVTSEILVARVEGVNETFLQRGFFTPQGDVVTGLNWIGGLEYFEVGDETTIAWTANGREERRQARVVQTAGVADISLPLLALLRIVGPDPAPRSQFPVGDSTRLDFGSVVERYISPTDKRQGTVEDKNITLDVEGGGKVPTFIPEGGINSVSVLIPIELVRATFAQSF
jgi:hypothetical protein